MNRKLVIVALLAVLTASLSFALVANAQDDVTVTWRTRPDNQAEIDVYTSLSDSIDAKLDGQH